MARSAASAATTARGGGVRGEGGGGGRGRTVPFVGSGRGGSDSYNVVSSVSKAVRKARRSRPREVRILPLGFSV